MLYEGVIKEEMIFTYCVNSVFLKFLLNLRCLVFYFIVTVLTCRLINIVFI